MGFQILNSEKSPIEINALDKEACEFWQKEVHPKLYCSPNDSPSFNWFDTIGFNIHCNHANWYRRTDDKITWKAVKESLCLTFINVLTDKVEDITRVREELLKEHFALIDYWESKGYEPIKVTD